MSIKNNPLNLINVGGTMSKNLFKNIKNWGRQNVETDPVFLVNSVNEPFSFSKFSTLETTFVDEKWIIPIWDMLCNYTERYFKKKCLKLWMEGQEDWPPFLVITVNKAFSPLKFSHFEKKYLVKNLFHSSKIRRCHYAEGIFKKY